MPTALLTIYLLVFYQNAMPTAFWAAFWRLIHIKCCANKTPQYLHILSFELEILSAYDSKPVTQNSKQHFLERQISYYPLKNNFFSVDNWVNAVIFLAKQ